MKKNDLNRMISLIDDKKLADSEKAGRRRFRWQQAVAMAACAALLLSSVLILPRIINGGHDTPQPVPGVSSTPLQIVSTSATEYYAPGLVANNTGFIITTNNATKETLEKSIYLDPPVEYTIEELEKDSYLLTPAADLPDNTVISLAQVKDAKVTESWAYQTKKDLTVSGTYPRDGVMSVSVDSVIEIVLSYADVENFDEYVTISPEISGKWEHLGKTWRFKPDRQLEKDTLYTVGVRAGFKNESMTNTKGIDFVFSTFDDATEQPQLYTPLNASVDGIFTFRPDDAVQFGFTPNGEKHGQISRIALEQINGTDAFLQKLENQNAQVDSTALGDAAFTWQNLSLYGDVEDSVVLDDKLPEGYYIARIYDMANRERSTVLFQVNRISAYTLETLQEALVWAAQDGELAEGLTVSYNGSTQTTDEDGIARFDIAKDKEMLYATVGENCPLVIGFPAFSGEYINGYVYTDRALYRENDLIQVWGYVPPEQLKDGDGEFTVSFGNYYNGCYEEIPVVPDEFGCFTVSYELADYKAGDLNILLNYNGTQISSRMVEIRNYTGQYYSYKILMDKNYIRRGEVLEFDVKVTHLSQVAVAGKMVYACGQWGKTDENGIAHFSLATDSLNEDTNTLYNCKEITVSNGDGLEMNTYTVTEYVYIFNSDIALLTNNNGEDQYTVRAYKLNFDSDVSILSLPYYTFDTEAVVNALGTPIENAVIRGTMWERKYERYIESYEYNEYTKTQLPKYKETDPEISAVQQWTLTADGGIATIDLSDVTFKDAEEMTRYYYELELTADDSLPVTLPICYDWYAGNQNGESKNPYPGYSATEWASWANSNYRVGDTYNKFAYQFRINGDSHNYAFGATIPVTLYDRYGSIPTDGKILRVLMQRDVADGAVVSPDELSFTYPDELMPNIQLVGAYFKDGVFYRIPSLTLNHDSSEKELEVTATPDREEYAPGEEITLDINVKNASGGGVAAEVSVSVVDEAALAMGENDADILGWIFSRIDYPCYHYSTYQDLTLIREFYGWGGGRGPGYRSNFADTAYFGTVITDKDGHASVTFKLPDTVTTYRITTQAAGKKMQAGIGKSAVTVKQDFFIQHTEPRGVKTTDDLVVGACGIGGTDGVNFTFTLKETDQHISASAENSVMAYANFGKLPLGTYTVQIDAQSGEYSDGVEYTVNIISTAQTVRESKRTKVSDGQTIEALKAPVVIEICNTDMARYRTYLEYLRGTVNDRLDTQIGNREAIILQNQFYGESAYIPYINILYYKVYTDIEYGNSYLFAPLKDAESDPILTALATEYFQPDIDSVTGHSCDPYEYALLLAAHRKAILPDLAYLAAEAETDREKLLVSLAYAFLGDYGNARENYVQTADRNSRSLQAMAATFIDRETAAELLDELISDMPEDRYLRFAVLSYINKNTELIDREESVTVTGNDINETVAVKGLEVKRLVFNKKQLSDLKITASTENIDVVYYYDTAVDRLRGDDVTQDITVSLKKDGTVYSDENKMAVNDEITLEINYDCAMFSYITVALPNNLRMTQAQDTTTDYTVVNKDDHLIIYLSKDSPQSIKIPLYVACEGEYTFEPVVRRCGNQYHISEAFTYSAE